MPSLPRGHLGWLASPWELSTGNCPITLWAWTLVNGQAGGVTNGRWRPGLRPSPSSRPCADRFPRQPSVVPVAPAGSSDDPAE
jgi:hypothetical protein